MSAMEQLPDTWLKEEGEQKEEGGEEGEGGEDFFVNYIPQPHRVGKNPGF